MRLVSMSALLCNRSRMGIHRDIRSMQRIHKECLTNRVRGINRRVSSRMVDTMLRRRLIKTLDIIIK